MDGGTFYRTYTNNDSGPTAEADPASVSAFVLDKYEVTVGRFREFRGAAFFPDGTQAWTPPPGSGKHKYLNGGEGLLNSKSGSPREPGWVAADDAFIQPTNQNLTDCHGNPFPTWTTSPSSNEKLPISCVTWWEAYAFCIWDAGFLPSEAEWEYAAAGGSDQREYPWGSTDPGTASQYAIYGCYYNPSGICAGTATVAPVGSAPLGAGAWGQLDLAGNLWEWTLDLWAAYGDPCTDCGDFTAGSARGARGGVFGNPASNLLASYRDGSNPGDRSLNIGIRCARNP